MREFMRRVPIKVGKRGKDDEKDLVRDILGKWPKLIAWLEEKEYFTAPASKNHHGAHEGGLIEHSLQVAYYRIQEYVWFGVSKKIKVTALYGCESDI